LIRTSVADLFDQRRPFGRLALTHVLMTAGDTMFAVSLAGSLFFSISPTAAKDKVLLYLVLTMAPFAVVAPLLGPLIDRSRGARRAMVVVSAVGRAALCPFLARDIHSLLLFPEAFVMLVLSKVYLVTKGALVPEMAALGLLDGGGSREATPAAPTAPTAPAEPPARAGGPPVLRLVEPSPPVQPEYSDVAEVPAPEVTYPSGAGSPVESDQLAPDLAGLNARLGLLASLSALVFALPAVGALKLGGPSLVLWLAMAVFVAAVVAGARLPVSSRRSGREGVATPVEPGTRTGPSGLPGLPGPSGPSGPTAPGGSPTGAARRDVDDWEDEQDLALLRPIATHEVLLALVPMSVLKALLGFMTFLFAFGLRREGAATWWFGLLLGSTTAGALVGVLLVSRLRKLLSEQQILVAALWLVSAVALLGFFQGTRLFQAVVAFAVGIAGAVAKPSFDALVQRYVLETNQGRAFARFETQLQLVWVVGAFVPVVLSLPITGGDLVMTVVAAVGALSYMSSLRTVRSRA